MVREIFPPFRWISNIALKRYSQGEAWRTKPAQEISQDLA